ncbi:MAG: polysaccharide deacetylase family protein [Burkholderiales bacterium]|nr:polysaccharide deacetylase family protein [Burkholderiales bacterium]
MESLLRAFGNLFSPAGPGAKLSILIYHRVLPEADPMLPDVVDADRFDAQMGVLSSLFNLLPLSEAVMRLKSGSLPARAACITFDDGYADNAEVALPILKKYGVPATFFIATGYLNGGIMFNDKVIETVRRLSCGEHVFPEIGMRSLTGNREKTDVVRDLLSFLKYRPLSERQDFLDRIIDSERIVLPANLMMRSDQVRLLADSGMEIGGHTVNHPILNGLNARQAKQEIGEGRIALEEITGQSIRLFAYPNGVPGRDYGREHIQLLREMGFEAAVSTSRGVARRESDPFQLPRFTPWDIPLTRFSCRLAGNLLRTRILTA